MTRRGHDSLVSQRLCWRNPGCSSRGHVGRQHGHQKQRRHDDDIGQDVYAAGIEQHGIHELLEAKPIASPITVPIPTSTMPLPITRRSTSELAAPRAMRIPISRVLRLTLYATNPYKPAIASTRPTTPMVPTSFIAIRGPSTAWFR